MRYWLTLFTMIFSPIALSIVEIPADTETHIYGLGVDVDHSYAHKLALADISQKISTRVKSNVSIEQTKMGRSSQTRSSQQTNVESLSLDLPNVQVIKNVQEKGKWWVLIKVERSLIKASLNKQIRDISQQLGKVISQYKGKVGPSCWHNMQLKAADKNLLGSLLPAYIGSGAKENDTLAYVQQIESFEQLLSQCTNSNTYQLIVEPKLSKSFELKLKSSLSKLGVNFSKTGLGTLLITVEHKYLFSYNNHISILSANLMLLDEDNTSMTEKSVKVRGTSFNSEQESNRKAEQSMVNKMKELQL